MRVRDCRAERRWFAKASTGVLRYRRARALAVSASLSAFCDGPYSSIISFWTLVSVLASMEKTVDIKQVKEEEAEDGWVYEDGYQRSGSTTVGDGKGK